MYDCHFCLRVTAKRRGEKKGQSLAYWFQQSTESGDSFIEEVPPSNPNRKELMRKEQLVAVSMLVAMRTEDGLRRGPSWLLPKNLVWHAAQSIIYGREQKVHMSWAQLIVQNLFHKKTLEEGLCI